ncbi:fluoride efflux transporter CrcB [Rubellicoccus peritrichatus]|uniref:Fluoride-specific ion channel FluC n=1 Tax=Rubellicoccus peritrichatus TaxID=3080537 RepID=A0AAQ3LEX8_9BACT|nr:fluoride efflux transporter CrcB [Puniceicoccus sp. CR14]WOO42670.1 fluoride efflux transporter CrcB [Puniceicoccus sp. CR14]
MNALQLLAIAAGGAIGAVLRALMSVWIPTEFPWATFVVNVVGSLIIGFIFGLEATHLTLHPHLRVFLTAGFCGALTTFSTFSYQTLSLFNTGQTSLALVNIALNVVITLVAVWGGLKLATAIFA